MQSRWRKAAAGTKKKAGERRRHGGVVVQRQKEVQAAEPIYSAARSKRKIDRGRRDVKR